MPQPDLFSHNEELDVPVGPSGIVPDLMKQILAERAKAASKIILGGCKTMESYAEAVGRVKAYDFVLGYAERKREDFERELGTPIEDEPL